MLSYATIMEYMYSKNRRIPPGHFNSDPWIDIMNDEFAND